MPAYRPPVFDGEDARAVHSPRGGVRERRRSNVLGVMRCAEVERVCRDEKSGASTIRRSGDEVQSAFKTILRGKNLCSRLQTADLWVYYRCSENVMEFR